MNKLFINIKWIPLLLFSVVISLYSCGDDDTEEMIPSVVARFSATVNEETGEVEFLNTSESADTYHWTFEEMDGGSAPSSTSLINPVVTFETGVYTVTLTAENDRGDSDTFQDMIAINVPLPVLFPITFDVENVDYTPTVFNGATFEIVTNPDLSGSNTESSNVGAITNSGAQFEGLFFELGLNVDLSTDNSIAMEFWSQSGFDVLMKLEKGTGADVEIAASHTGAGWETLYFTLPSSDSYGQLTLFVDGPGTSAGTFYFDNIRQVSDSDIPDRTAPVITLVGSAQISQNVGQAFTDPGATAIDNVDGDISANIVVGGDMVDVNSTGTYTITYNVSDAAGNAASEVTRTVEVTTVATAPNTSAPLPPARDAADVISIYSDSYTNIPINTYDPNWGQSGHMQVDPAFDPGDGNLALAYPNFNYQGTEFMGTQNASAMEFLHVDIWVASGTERQVRVSPINDNNNGGTGAMEFQVEIPLMPGSWNSVDIPMSAFTGMTWDNLFQFIFNGQFNPDGTENLEPFDIYLDNIYLYREGGMGGEPSLPFDFEDQSAPFIPFENSPTLGNIANPDMNGNNSARVLEFNKVLGAPWFSGFVFDDGTRMTPLIDLANGTTFSIKIWSPKAGINVRFQLEDNDDQGAGNPSFSVDQTLDVANQWVTLTYDFSTTGIDNTHTYKRLTIFPDFDPANQVPVDPGTIYYFDDIEQL